MAMLEHYKKELIAIAVVFGLLSYTIHVCAATIMMQPSVIKVAELAKAKPTPAKKAEPAKATKKEAAKPAEPKKDPNRKKPTLKKKYADKK
jgi:hypothetical protein